MRSYSVYIKIYEQGVPSKTYKAYFTVYIRTSNPTKFVLLILCLGDSLKVCGSCFIM
jgi:hypothetical protein